MGTYPFVCPAPGHQGFPHDGGPRAWLIFHALLVEGENDSKTNSIGRHLLTLVECLGQRCSSRRYWRMSERMHLREAARRPMKRMRCFEALRLVMSRWHRRCLVGNLERAVLLFLQPSPPRSFAGPWMADPLPGTGNWLQMRIVRPSDLLCETLPVSHSC